MGLLVSVCSATGLCGHKSYPYLAFFLSWKRAEPVHSNNNCALQFRIRSAAKGSQFGHSLFAFVLTLHVLRLQIREFLFALFVSDFNGCRISIQSIFESSIPNQRSNFGSIPCGRLSTSLSLLPQSSSQIFIMVEPSEKLYDAGEDRYSQETQSSVDSHSS